MSSMFNKSLSASPNPVNPKQPPSKLWYKNYMVWIFVIGFPLAMVITCIWFLFYSIKVEDPVVRDDWFMDGKTLYADVSKDKLAHDLDLTGNMMITADQVSFRLNAPAQDKFTPPNELLVEISHATQKSKDRDFVIKKLADGSYAGSVKLDPGMGKYYIVVHDPANKWRLRTVTELPNAKSLTFKPLTAFDAQKKS